MQLHATGPSPRFRATSRIFCTSIRQWDSERAGRRDKSIDQLLTYLSEIASAAQTERANKFLFKDAKIVYPATYDLHIVLADFNDRGKKGPITTSTHILAKKFKEILDGRAEQPHHVGRVMCLHMDVDMFDGTLALEWCA